MEILKHIIHFLGGITLEENYQSNIHVQKQARLNTVRYIKSYIDTLQDADPDELRAEISSLLRIYEAQVSNDKTEE